ncbi:unnamed protein product, partial [Mesorhabditis spiculigera]
MASNYVVTCKKATVVTQALLGNFTGPDDLNLFLSKMSRIEIHAVAKDGLRLVQEVPIFGRIAAIAIMRPPKEPTDLLVVLTEKLHISILDWKNGELRTRATGNLVEKVGRPSEYGIKMLVHKRTGLIVIRIYDGSLKVITWKDSTTEGITAFNMRIEDSSIVDLAFLDTDTPKIAYIYQDPLGRHIKVIPVETGHHAAVPHHKENAEERLAHIEAEAHTIIPVPKPYGGVIAIGRDTIMYHRFERPAQPAIVIAPHIMHNTLITCSAPIDPNGQRFLLGAKPGELFMLLLDTDTKEGTVSGIKVETLGRCSMPECVTYVDNGVVFIGSRMGDSQLIHLNEKPDVNGSFVSVIETFQNVGPVRDMLLLQAENGQSQLFTCSGAYKDGSMRIIRTGIGIDERASVDYYGIKSISTLAYQSELDNHLVVSTSDETHVLRIDGEELEQLEDALGLETNEHTLYAACTKEGNIIQITQTGIRIVKAGAVLIKWASQHGEISVSSVNIRAGKALIASGRYLHYLNFDGTEISELNSLELEQEAACLDISSIDDSDEARLAAIGLWTSNSCELRTLPDLRLLSTDQLSRKVLPRSCLLSRFDETLFLLVALGDGTLFYFRVDEAAQGALVDGKKVSLGTVPLLLNPFKAKERSHVFVCSDRPAIIYACNGKLIFSNINVRTVRQMCPINAAAYKNCMVMCGEESMVIGRVDDIEKLHIRTVPLGESPSRLAYLPDSNKIVLLVCRDKSSEAMSISRTASRSSTSKLVPPQIATRSTPLETHSVVVLDGNTFEVLHSHELGPNEEAQSLIAARLGDDPKWYVFVGTTMIALEETESKAGRIIVFDCEQDDRAAMSIISEKDMKGCTYSMGILNGKLLAAVNSSVRLFEWNRDKELKLDCSHFQYIQALYVKTRGDLLLVGDMLRGMGLLTYKAVEGSFEESARYVLLCINLASS